MASRQELFIYSESESIRLEDGFVETLRLATGYLSFLMEEFESADPHLLFSIALSRRAQLMEQWTLNRMYLDLLQKEWKNSYQKIMNGMIHSGTGVAVIEPEVDQVFDQISFQNRVIGDYQMPSVERELGILNALIENWTNILMPGPQFADDALVHEVGAA